MWKSSLQKLRCFVPKKYEEEFDKVTSKDLENVMCYVKTLTNDTLAEENWGLIREGLKAKLREAQVELQLEEVRSLPFNRTVKSIIVCPVIDRLEPSIDRTLKGVICHRNMVLLVLHHCAPHTKSNPETKARLTIPQFGELGDVIDLMFWHSDGLYECDTNRLGLSALVRFLKPIPGPSREANPYNRPSPGQPGKRNAYNRSLSEPTSHNRPLPPRPVEVVSNRRTPQYQHASSTGLKEDPTLSSGDTNTGKDSWENVYKSECGSGPCDYGNRDDVNTRRAEFKYQASPPKKIVDCFVKSSPGTDLMGAGETLWSKVKSRFLESSSGVDLRITYTDVTGCGRSAKTFILCPVISRLGSNAAHAMKGVNGDKNMAMVCFHHVAPHVTYHDDSQLALQDDKFQCLGAIVDVLFWGGVGMYDCPVNDSAVRKICHFISPGSDLQPKRPSSPEPGCIPFF